MSFLTQIFHLGLFAVDGNFLGVHAFSECYFNQGWNFLRGLLSQNPCLNAAL